MNPVLRLFILAFASLPLLISAATFTVTNTSDMGPGSLRDAISQANANGLSDTINFFIPNPGIQTIRPLSQLPWLNDPAGVFINGLTQSGASAGANPPATALLTIELNGTSAGPAHGLWIVSPNNTVQGIVVDSFEQDGIRIQGVATGTFNNHIYCSIIGMDPSGTTARGNGRNRPAAYWAGVNIVVTPQAVGFAFRNLVERNLISGNYAEGVGISSCPPGDVYANIVRKNYIGTAITGTADFGNVHDGVYIGEGAHDNLVDTNIIAGNDFEGVCIVGFAANSIFTNRNVLIDNIIGLDINRARLPNSLNGVSIGKYGTLYSGGFASANVVGPNNIIAANGRSGVMVWEHPVSSINADGNLITRNAMSGNGLLGIDLGDDTVTVNDPADPDSSANQQCNYPVITGAQYNGVQTTIVGTLDIGSNPSSAAVEVFAVRSPSTYNCGEGDYYLGSTTPDAMGNWAITVTDTMAKNGKTVTATATDAGRNTSEFAVNAVVVLVSGITSRNNGGTKRELCRVRHVNCGYLFETAAPNAGQTFTIAIYAISGKVIRILGNGIRSGQVCRCVWDGTGNDGKKVPAGIYLYRITTGALDRNGAVVARYYE